MTMKIMHKSVTFGLAVLLLCGGALSTGCEGWQNRRTHQSMRNEPAIPTEDQQQRLAEAQAALDQQAYDEALAMFRDILAENPTITTAYVGIGAIHLKQKNYPEAEPVFARAARLEPRNFDAQFGHGVSLQMLERLEDAIRAYHRAITVKPNHPRANLNLATTYLQLNEPNSARVFAEKAVEVDPENGAARANLGAIYEQLGRNEEAIHQYLTAIELMDDPTPLMLNLINVLARERRYREAVNTAENLVKLEPSAEVYERLGWGYFRLSNYERSIWAYRRAVSIDPGYWPAWSGIGVNAMNTWLLSDGEDRESFLEAREAFRRSLRLNPDQPKLVTLMSNYGL